MKSLYLATFFTLALCFSNLNATTEKEESHDPAHDHARRHQVYHDPVEFIRDFLSPAKRPDWSLRRWALEMIWLLAKDKNLQQFLADFKRTVAPTEASRDAGSLKTLFVAYQSKFPPAVRKLIIDMGIKNVGKALDERVKMAK